MTTGAAGMASSCGHGRTTRAQREQCWMPVGLFSSVVMETASLAASSFHRSETLRTIPLAARCLCQPNTAVVKPLDWTLDTTTLITVQRHSLSVPVRRSCIQDKGEYRHFGLVPLFSQSHSSASWDD